MACWGELELSETGVVAGLEVSDGTGADDGVGGAKHLVHTVEVLVLIIVEIVVVT